MSQSPIQQTNKYLLSNHAGLVDPRGRGPVSPFFIKVLVR